jgi:D-alanine-D-alanine ligase
VRKQILKTKKIGVLMGGKSTEREVSVRSGKAICNALNFLKYNAVPIDVGDDLCEVLKKAQIDIAFIALHGGLGENGAVQGMLEVTHIPYTGSGILASALAMDKEASKKVFIYHGIPVPPFKIIQDSVSKIQNSKFETDFEMPWVVKPVAEGSSVGVEIVRHKSKFRDALEKAFHYGEKVIVEKYIEGKEIHIGILNNKVLGGVEVRPSLEFYNYKAKYTPGLTEYILPPQIGKETYEKAKNVSLSAHKALGCRGATRIDLRIDSNGNPLILEVNTIPGMTETSLLPKIAKQIGIEFPSLIEKILGEIHEE